MTIKAACEQQWVTSSRKSNKVNKRQYAKQTMPGIASPPGYGFQHAQARRRTFRESKSRFPRYQCGTSISVDALRVVDYIKPPAGGRVADDAGLAVVLKR